MSIFTPADEAELAEIIAWAAAERQPLEIVGGGSKRGFGRPVSAGHQLDLSRLRGIIDYDPSELVLTARAATPMAEIARALGESRQHLAFEPPDWSTLLDEEGTAGTPTLGGVIACNLSGPRRIRAGAARDHFLGFAAVNGWGDPWRAGGRVVKNVTGYDLSKLQAGAFGTLSALTEISVKVMPVPPLSCSLAIDGLDAARAVSVMAEALNTPHEVSAVAWLPAAIAARAGVAGAGEDGHESGGASGRGSVTLLRLEGPGPSIAYRERALGALFGTLRPVAEPASRAAWRAIGDAGPLLAPQGRVVWRLCPTPSRAAALLDAIRARLGDAGCEFFLDWGGGLVWLALAQGVAGPGVTGTGVAEAGLDGRRAAGQEVEGDCGAGAVRAALAEAGGGHATLVRAPRAARARVAVFEPQRSAALAALTRRVKAGFDPAGVLNPGRMHEGL